MTLPGDVDYPLWGWGATEASELTGVTLTDAQLTRAHRELERALARQVTTNAWELEQTVLGPDEGYPRLAGYPSRRAWTEAVSWQAAWRQAEPQQAQAEAQVTAERLGDHQVTYQHAVGVGGSSIASEAHRALTAAGLLAGRLAGYSR